jgi:hypothetical protein
VAAELKAAFGVTAKKEIHDDGTFDVLVDGKKIFSMAKEGRFPKRGEIVGIIKALKSGSSK